MIDELRYVLIAICCVWILIIALGIYLTWRAIQLAVWLADKL